MAQILHKRASTAAKVPLTTDLALGELAINTNDGKLFLKKNNGADAIVEIGAHTFTGDVTGSGNGSIALTLANSGVTAGTYGGKMTVDAKGRVTAANALTSSDVTTALAFTPENVANKNVANGYAGLGSDGKLPSSLMPAVAITDTFVVASQAAMLAAVAQRGDIAVRTDLSKSFILVNDDPTQVANWQEILGPVGSSNVYSINGYTGTVTLTTSDIGEGTNLYFTNARAIAAPLTGFAVGSNTAITATDSILVAFGKVQAQLNNKASSGANSSITSLTGLTTALSISQGGTGGTTAAAAKTNLVLDKVENKTSQDIRNEITLTDMTNGLSAIGWGMTTAAPLITDIDSATIVSGIYYTNNTTLGTFPVSAVGGCVIHKVYGSAGFQLFQPYGTQTLYFRTRSGSAWMAWNAIHNSSSLTKLSQLTNDSNYVKADGSIPFTGSVGIGTAAAPAAKLDVYNTTAGNLNAIFTRGASDNNFALTARNGTGTTASSEHARFGMEYLTGGFAAGFSFLRGGSATDGTIAFMTSNAEKARLDNNGNFMLGTTSVINGGKLSVVSSIAGSGAVAVAKNTNTTGSSAWVTQDDTGNKYCEVGIVNSATTLDSSYGSAGEGYVRSSANAIGLNLSSATGPMRFGVGGTERARFDTVGNFGISATPSAWNAIIDAIDLGPYAAMASSSSAVEIYGNGYWAGGATGYVYKNAGAMSIYQQTAGSHRWMNAPTAAAGASTTSMNTAMILDANSNLGIGTGGAVKGGAGGFINVEIGKSTLMNHPGSGSIYFGKNWYYNGGYKYSTGGNTGLLYVQDGGGHSWHVAPSGTVDTAIAWTQAMTLDNNGNFMVGTTAPVNATTDIAHLNRSQNAATQLMVNNQNNGTSASAGIALAAYGNTWTMSVPSSTTYVNPLVFSRSGTEYMRLSSDGKLGIGTVPNYKLHLDNGDAAISNGGNASGKGGTLYLNAMSTTTSPMVGIKGSLDWAGSGEEQGNMLFLTRATTGATGSVMSERMRLTNNGNLLLNTQSDESTRFLIRQDVAGISNLLTIRNSYSTTASIPKSRLGFGGYRDVQANYLIAAIDAQGVASGAGDAAHAGNLIFSTSRMDYTGPVEAMRIDQYGSVLCTGAAKVTGTASAHGQGVWLEWNRSNGGGETCILNQKGGGGGGIIFGEIDTGNNTTERMRINSVGNLLVGTTSDNGSKLQVNGGVTATRAILGQIIETKTSVLASSKNASNQLTLDLSTNGGFRLTMDASPCILIFGNPPAGSNFFGFTLMVVNDATAGRSLTFPTCKWANGQMPARTTTANAIDWFYFQTDDGGSTWHATMSTQDSK